MLMHWYPLMGCSCSRSAACPLTSNGTASFLSFMSCIGFAPRHEAENCLCKSLHEFHFSEKKKNHFAVFSFPWIISTTHFATDSITEGKQATVFSYFEPRTESECNASNSAKCEIHFPRKSFKTQFAEGELRALLDYQYGPQLPIIFTLITIASPNVFSYICYRKIS